MILKKAPDLPRTRTKTSGGSRAATKALRRQQLIDSTVDSIAKRGFSGTTLADVADGAGLSRGIVNFRCYRHRGQVAGGGQAVVTGPDDDSIVSFHG